MTTISEITRIERHSDAGELAEHAYTSILTLLDDLDASDWNARTECPAWTVADMVGHMIGAAKGHASVPRSIRDQAWAARHKKEYGGSSLDAMNARQVAEHADLTPTERVAQLREIAPAAVRGRMRTPSLMRRMKITMPTAGSVVTGMPDHIMLGHLMDAILTRDVWLHRIDIARATGRELDWDPEADGRIVADVVAEWGTRHGQPFSLELTGPAGGHFRQGEGGEPITMDAIEFCRVLSGRAHGDGLLATKIFF
ncbi:maleylpyruvate isomerase family mycothiol-dependent enzyme [Nocardioides limicola]|uniref:maleylpyruvate isomerase family mycothiol-dependent enzyme n=1 Tax=Nocardioides limicola TaxID=2803368 RepID=UPI00193C0F86|nr:maleylpyruvate isomerase family mycothiol-dependent enzyme [Nocardioides sp. DJM-14]